MIFNIEPLDPTTPISPMTSIGSGHRISSPSPQDHYDSLAEINSRLQNLNDPIDDKDLYKRLSNTLVDVRQKGYGRFFGESSHAIWQLDNVTLGKHPGIHDMALIRPAEQLRLGKNLIPLPPGKYVSNFIRESTDPVDAGPVYKVVVGMINGGLTAVDRRSRGVE
jgi:hypothetical protein